MYLNYWYRSGTNHTMRQALSDIAQKAEQLGHLTPGDCVLDIGCNDGTLLSSYRTHGLRRIGCDPAENLAPLASKVADRVVTRFFTADVFSDDPELKALRPKVVTSIAMFYDLEDPNTFVADVKKVMHPEGVWIVQMAYLPLMLKQNAFDNICHEHLEYYSLASFEHLLARHDLEVVGVELNDLNGGSIRTYIRSRRGKMEAFADSTYRAMAAEGTASLRDQEFGLGLGESRTYADFAMWAERIRSDLVGFVREQKAKRKKIYAYGASTKGNTLLQYCGFTRGDIPAAAERNPAKWGRETVGSRIPIISEEEARGQRPDYFLILPWHFVEEFKRRERGYLAEGGRFILPMPCFSLI
jgi:NDP-4-keto-2,6-dideoxyhexose 3-C-methyltransferase